MFFFNVTATTVIYTYYHTLSLHDALPICLYIRMKLVAVIGQASAPGALVITRLKSLDEAQSAVAAAAWKLAGCGCTQLPAAFCIRSEEHTSELQSLMRISYAVFCLKKKKKQQSIP